MNYELENKLIKTGTRYLAKRLLIDIVYDVHISSSGIACVQFDDTRIVSGSSDKTIKVGSIFRYASLLVTSPFDMHPENLIV